MQHTGDKDHDRVRAGQERGGVDGARVMSRRVSTTGVVSVNNRRQGSQGAIACVQAGRGGVDGAGAQAWDQTADTQHQKAFMVFMEADVRASTSPHATSVG